RLHLERGERVQELDAIGAAFTESQDTSTAYLDAGAADLTQGLEAIRKAARRDDLRVIRFRRVEIVVVVVEAGLRQALRLTVPQQTERCAGFEPERLHLPDHLEDRLELLVLGAAIRRAHAEPSSAGCLRTRG